MAIPTETLRTGTSNDTDRFNDMLLFLYDTHIHLRGIILGAIMYFVVLLTVCGNALVLVAVARIKQLHSVFNVYVVNLAITDISVGLIGMNFLAAYNLAQRWPFDQILCNVWIFGDFGMTTASIFTMLVISLDRYWSVRWPNAYRIHNNKRKAIIATAVIWGSVLIMWTPAFLVDRLNNSKPGECYFDPSKNKAFVLVVGSVGYHGSTLIMIFCYINVFLAVRKRSKVRTLRQVFASDEHTTTSPKILSGAKMLRHPSKNSRPGTCPSTTSCHVPTTRPLNVIGKCYPISMAFPAVNVISEERPGMENTVSHTNITQAPGQSGDLVCCVAPTSYCRTIELDQTSEGGGTATGHNRSVRGCQAIKEEKEKSCATSSTSMPARVTLVEKRLPFTAAPPPSRDAAPSSFLRSDDGHETLTSNSSDTLRAHSHCHSGREERNEDGQQNQTHNATSTSKERAVNTSGSEFTLKKIKTPCYGHVHKTVRTEKKIFLTLTYVMAGYLICWFPYHVSLEVMAFRRVHSPERFYAFTYWLSYFNSTLNPFLYNFSNSDFHHAFMRLIGWKKRKLSQSMA